MQRWLSVTKGPLMGQRIPLGRQTTIGRGGDVDLQLVEKGVSRHHARLTQKDDGALELLDLSSTNGTFVGGERIESQVLQCGDRFVVGDSEFEYRDEADGSLLEQLKLVSGPAREATPIHWPNQPAQPGAPASSSERSRTPTAQTQRMEAVGCADPLHGVAVRSGWAFCPCCGEALRKALVASVEHS